MMRIHLQESAKVAPGYERQALSSWEADGLVTGVVRSCDQLMVSLDNKETLTDDPDVVTCKRCLSKLNRRDMEMDDFNDIKKERPPLDTPVIIRTNWREYLARLNPSSFGGFVFQVFDSKHTVELTTVTGWKLAVST